MSYKSVPQECPTTVSYKSVPQECPTRVSHKSFLQECPTRVSRVSYKSVIWTYVAFGTCLHSGSWASFCVFFCMPQFTHRCADTARASLFWMSKSWALRRLSACWLATCVVVYPCSHCLWHAWQFSLHSVVTSCQQLQKENKNKL